MSKAKVVETPTVQGVIKSPDKTATLAIGSAALSPGTNAVLVVDAP